MSYSSCAQTNNEYSIILFSSLSAVDSGCWEGAAAQVTSEWRRRERESWGAVVWSVCVSWWKTVPVQSWSHLHLPWQQSQLLKDHTLLSWDLYLPGFIFIHTSSLCSQSCLAWKLCKVHIRKIWKFRKLLIKQHLYILIVFFHSFISKRCTCKVFYSSGTNYVTCFVWE